MKERNILKHNVILSLFIFILALLASFSFSSNYNVVAASRVVNIKVGWYQSVNFQEGLENEEKSGYSYEYLQKISNYNTWTYEYVYGEWTELFNKLKTGEIDILAGVSKTAEREQYLSFPNYEMGNESYYIYQHSDNKTMKMADLSSFNGKKIGAITNNTMSDFLELWNNNNNTNLNIVYFDSFEERDEAFNNNKLDGIVLTDNNVSADLGYSIVTKVGDDPYYLAVNKSRQDILATLNESLSLINETDPYYLQNLQYEFFGSKSSNYSKTELEVEWLSNHNSLTVGYLDNYLPYCGTNSNGEVTGLITDVINAIVYELDLDETFKINYKSYPNYISMVEAINKGEIDTAFPIGGNAWDLEQDGIDATSTVLSAGMNLVYKDKYDLNDNGSFAVNKNNKLQYYYIKDNFPNSKIVEFDSIQECLNAVLKGDVKYTTINGLRVNIYTEDDKYNALSSIQLQKKDNRYFGVNPNDIGLLLLLNRGINLIGTEFAINASYAYIELNNNFTLLSFIKKYMFHILGAILIFIVIATILTILYIRKTKRVNRIIKQNLEDNEKLTKQLEQNNTMLEDLTAEQESQIEEITTLNNELEERQAQLEEATSEQESQLEEISALNVKLIDLKDAADEANKAKSSFLFNMSHDIRTPMNAIIGYRNLLEKHQDDKEKREDYLCKIDEASKVLLSIINNVLEMARIEKGNVALVETVNSVEQFNDAIYSIYQEMMENKKITFTTSVNVSNHYVYCDAVKVREVFDNILSNAYKYTNEGGSVSMVLEELPSTIEGFGIFRTTISDTGIGMSEDFIPHLFEEFARESSVTEGKIEGTGLGMSIVKRLLDLMDGTIEVKSKLNEGTTFIITIPHRIAEKADLIDYTKLEINNDLFVGKRILLAEDNEFNAEIAISILNEAGFVVDLATDGVICYEKLLNNDANYYDCILMDVQMPNMNGYDTTKKIRKMADKIKANIPIIAMTANAFEEDREQALKSGMNEHLAKPINIPDLLKVLTVYLKK